MRNRAKCGTFGISYLFRAPISSVDFSPRARKEYALATFPRKVGMKRVRVLCVTITLLLTSASALAQNSEDQNTFDFSLPGARSRAIGGAFVAIADDATAAYSNPAGLTQLFRPEVSIELRHWNLTSRVIDTGHGFGSATGTGVDTVSGFVDRDFNANV